MRTSRRWLAGTVIASVAIGTAIFLGGLAYAHWGQGLGWGFPALGYGSGGCHMMWDGDDDDYGTERGTYASLSLERARSIAESYIARYGPDLEIAEIMVFSNHFYVQARERSRARFAFEFLIDRDSGRVYPEPGPNMIWNTKYGHMSYGMGMFSQSEGTAEMSVSPEEALVIAQDYLDRTLPGAVADEPDAFYGYYTLHVLRAGEIAGMLSVNGYTGQVWPHTWHGEFLDLLGEEHDD